MNGLVLLFHVCRLVLVACRIVVCIRAAFISPPQKKCASGSGGGCCIVALMYSVSAASVLVALMLAYVVAWNSE